MKFNRWTASFVAGMFAVCVLSHGANAVTIDQDITDFSSIPSFTFNPTPDSSNLWSIQTVSTTNFARSPFENADGSQGPGYGLPFSSIQGGGFAVYSFTSPTSTFSILWGSPDSYNTLSFYASTDASGPALFTITGSALEIQNMGHDLVSFLFGSETFSSVELSSSQDAFEYTAAPDPNSTPLPAALPLFATGLGLLGYLGRRRLKRQQMAFNALAVA